MNNLYGDSIFESNNIEPVDEAVVEAILAIIIAAEIAVIGGIIHHIGKNSKAVQEYLSDPEMQKQFKIIYDAVIKGANSDKGIAKYKKYFSNFKSYSFNKKNVFTYNKNKENGKPEAHYCIKIPTFTVDIDKIFKDEYGTTARKYTEEYNEDQPDNCKPAPKFVKVLKNIDKSLADYISTIKNKKDISIRFSLDYDKKDVEIYYDNYFEEFDELTGWVIFDFNWNDLVKRAKSGNTEFED